MSSQTTSRLNCYARNAWGTGARASPTFSASTSKPNAQPSTPQAAFQPPQAQGNGVVRPEDPVLRSLSGLTVRACRHSHTIYLYPTRARPSPSRQRLLFATKALLPPPTARATPWGSPSRMSRKFPQQAHPSRTLSSLPPPTLIHGHLARQTLSPLLPTAIVSLSMQCISPCIHISQYSLPHRHGHQCAQGRRTRARTPSVAARCCRTPWLGLGGRRYLWSRLNQHHLVGPIISQRKSLWRQDQLR